MDGSDANIAQTITTDTDRLGLQILSEHISSATFHDSHKRLNETNPTVVKEWVRKWTPYLRSSNLSSIPAFEAQQDNPEQIIVDVFTWLFDLSSPSPIMWIHHEDRSQTSFFAHTIAKILDQLGKLSGSFFSSKQDDPVDITRIIPTLAFQLAQNIPATRPLIAQTVLHNSLIFDLQAESQIKRLIVDPLSFTFNSGNMGTRGIPYVFLIHGLEEFNSADHSQFSLLDAFSDALVQLASNGIPYRLLLVTRDSSYISRCISNTDIQQRVFERPIVTQASLGEDREMKTGAKTRVPVPWHLMNTLKGHTASVRSVAFSSDGTRLASGSYDKTVRLWDSQTGTLVACLQGHTGDVNGVAFSADGSTLASGSDDGTIRLWDVQTKALVTTLKGHSNWVFSVSFSRDGSRLASGSRDKTIRVWDVTTYSLVTILQGHLSSVHAVAFSPDGSRLASGSHDNTIRVWEGKTGSLIATLAGHTKCVYSVGFSSDGLRLASGSADRTIRLWDIKMGALVASLEGHTSPVLSVAFCPDSSMLASGSEDTTVRLWEVKTGSPITTLEGHSSYVLSVAFSPDGLSFVSASNDFTIRMWH